MGISQGGHIHGVGIGRIDNDPANPACSAQPHIFPGLAGINGFVYPIPHGLSRPDKEGFSCSGPYLFGSGRGYCQGPDSGVVRTVKNGFPGHPPVFCFKDPSGSGSHIRDIGISRNACYCYGTVPVRTYETEVKLFE